MFTLSRFNPSKAALLIFTLVAPVYALAGGNGYSSTISNQTKQYDPAGVGYVLQQSFIWGNNCVADAGKKSLNPGDSTVIKINQGCEWGGVKYKIVKNNETIGYLADSFRDQQFTLEISLPCNNGICTVTGLPPQASSSK